MGQATTARKQRAEGIRADTNWAQLFGAEIRRLILWVPVGLGVGIWLYFRGAEEPDPLWCLILVPPVLALATGWARRAGLATLILAAALGSMATGFSAALMHAHWIVAPMLAGSIDETVEGRVIAVTRARSGAPRVLLDHVLIYGLESAETPIRARVTLRPEDTPPPLGHSLRVYARLGPASGPVEPGGFDFRRKAYFERLGAVGFARGIAIPLGPAAYDSILDRTKIWLATQRSSLANALREALQGPTGAFAAAIIVGDRSGIEETDAEALRTANLSHLLAISGLHMGILTGLIFVAARMGLALVPRIGLMVSTKKVAACAALATGLLYLAMSGATVATQRAFIMVAVALIAVLLDRPAITLRALCVAATIILLIRPISLLDVGFQMSFAATTALVAGFAALRDFNRRREAPSAKSRAIPLRVLRGLAIYAGGLIATSLLAGLATAPFAAFHFNRMAPYGLPANLAAVPVMGLWVAPSAVASGLLAPFGLEGWGLRAMGAGIDWILIVAHWTADLPGAVRPAEAAPLWILGAIGLGGLWLALWQGPWRLFGILPILAAAFVWADPPPRPEVLISADGRLVGAIGSEGRALDKDRAASFVAARWLARDGDLADQVQAFNRPGVSASASMAKARLSNGWQIVVMRGRKAEEPECIARKLVVLYTRANVSGACRIVSRRETSVMQGLAIYTDGDEIEIVPSRRPESRLWSNQ
ncbi:MAG: ComEC/Rec2 family competence protein [Pseudomonadota bacterium]